MVKEKQGICPVCNEKLSFIKQTVEGNIKICAFHFEEAGIKLTEILSRANNNFTLEEVKERIETSQVTKEQSIEEKENFVSNKQIGNFVAFDDEQKKWATLSPFLGKVEQVYNYSDIVNFELLEDGESVAKGGLGRALVGGALFGGVGAVVGGVTGRRKTTGVCSSLKLKVTINNIIAPVVYINFIEIKTKKSGSTYKRLSELAQECLSTFQIICDRQKGEEKETVSSTPSPIDEIKQFKELLDQGIITQEEFDKKKKELLNL